MHATAHVTRMTRALRRLIVGLALVLAVSVTTSLPPVATPAQASSVFQPQEIRPIDDAERERAEKRRNVLLFFPAGAVLLVIVLVLTVKRRK